MRQSVPNDTFVDCFLSNDCQLNFADFIPFFLIFRLISFIFFLFLRRGIFILEFSKRVRTTFLPVILKRQKRFSFFYRRYTHNLDRFFFGLQFFPFCECLIRAQNHRKKNTIEYVQSLLSLFKILFSFRLFARDFNLCLIQKRCR